MPTEKEYNAAIERLNKKKNLFKFLGLVILAIPILLLQIFPETTGHFLFIYTILAIILVSYVSFVNASGKLSKAEMLIKEWDERELLYGESHFDLDNSPTIPDDELELKEFKKLRDEWNDQDFV